MFPPLVMLRGHAATKIFLWYLLLPVVLCFMSGKWRTQVADQIPQVFGEVLASHLVKVIAPLSIWHHDETKHFFTCQGLGALWFFWVTAIFSVNVLVIPAACSKKSTTECLVVEDEGGYSPLDLLCHYDKLSFCLTDGSPVAMMRRGEARSSLQTKCFQARDAEM